MSFIVFDSPSMIRIYITGNSYIMNRMFISEEYRKYLLIGLFSYVQNMNRSIVKKKINSP